jgi:hypothetical protein
MAFKTSAKKRTTSTGTEANPGPNVGENAAKNRDSNGKRKSFFDKFDKDHDGDIDMDDVLIWVRECFQWFASHRFGMICYGGVTLLSAIVNVRSWTLPLASIRPPAKVE